MDGFASASQVSDNSHKSELSSSSSDLVDEWRDWPGLPGHLLFDIADKFTDLDDYVSFGWVCTSWQTIFVHNMKSLGSPLLLIDPPDDKDYHNRRALYSLYKKIVCNFMVPLPRSKNCRGSSFGWLIIVEEKEEENYHVQLHNPFLGRTINLPTLDNIVQLNPDEYSRTLIFGEYLWKATISSDPSMSDDFIIMGSVSRYWGLAYFKPGNKCWTPIGDGWSLELESTTRFEDVIFYHNAGQFYALGQCGTLFAIKFCGDEQQPELIQVAPPLAANLLFACTNKCLVEDLVSGDLLQVCKKYASTENDENGKYHWMSLFLIFKFDHVEQSWRQIHNLGDKILFLGTTCSVLSSASDCPGCVPNCIYFTTQPWLTRYDPGKSYKPVTEGRYNLEDGTIQQFYSTTKDTRGVPATIWLEPTLLLKNLEQPKIV